VAAGAQQDAAGAEQHEAAGAAQALEAQQLEGAEQHEAEAVQQEGCAEQQVAGAAQALEAQQVVGAEQDEQPVSQQLCLQHLVLHFCLQQRPASTSAALKAMLRAAKATAATERIFLFIAYSP